MKKRIFAGISAFALLFIFLLSGVTAFAAGSEGKTYQQKVGQSTVYMHDLADLLTEKDEKNLLNFVNKYCADMQYNILFLTTDDALGKSTMVYSDDYMDELFPNTDENIAFVIDMDNREIYINTMGSTIRILSDSDINYALDQAYPKVKNQDYDAAMQKMSGYCLSRLESRETSGVVEPYREGFFTRFLREIPRHIFVSIVITVVVTIILLAKHQRANKPHPSTTYVSHENYDVEDKKENYIRTYQTVQRGYYKKSSSSGGSSGGSSHSSSSGRSHGGGGRSF